jgi:hypothetical protein
MTVSAKAAQVVQEANKAATIVDDHDVHVTEAAT